MSRLDRFYSTMATLTAIGALAFVGVLGILFTIVLPLLVRLAIAAGIIGLAYIILKKVVLG